LNIDALNTAPFIQMRFDKRFSRFSAAMVACLFW
jgi:hypothetical protein